MGLDFATLDLDQLRAFIEDLRRAGVKSFKHPSGIELTMDTTRNRVPVIDDESKPEGEF